MNTYEIAQNKINEILGVSKTDTLNRLKDNVHVCINTKRIGHVTKLQERKRLKAYRVKLTNHQ